MKIVIVGPGAMGCLFGGFLSLSGQEVWFLDKSLERAGVLQKKGILIEGISGRHQIKIKIAAQPNDIGVAELVIVCVKSYDTSGVVQSLLNIVGEKTIVFTLQNGLGNVEIISRCAEQSKILAGVTSEGATLLDTGRIKHAGRGTTVLGWIQPGNSSSDFDRDSMLKCIVDALSKAGFEIKTANNIEDFIWNKLVVNAGINALTAITRLNNGRLVEFESARNIMHKAVKEALAVASAKGISLTFTDAIAGVEEVCRATAGNVSSMLQDVLRNKRTEIEAINGAVIREAEKLKLAVPVNTVLTELVKTIEDSYSLSREPSQK